MRSKTFLTHPEIEAIQVVIHREDRDLYDAAVTEHPKLLSPVIGGESRQESCKAGIDALADKNCNRVLIHDAARPFLSQSVISNVLNGISDGMCALPAIAVADTVKRANTEGLVEETVSRDHLYLAQTPQGF